MMNQYEERLKKLIYKYKFNYEGIKTSIDIHKIVKKLFQSRCSNKKVALWGAGSNNLLTSHAATIINRYSTYMKEIVYLIDSTKELQGTKFLNYSVISPEEIKKDDIELIIVASRVSAKSIVESARKYAPWCEILDVYDELKKLGVVTPYNFYEEKTIYIEIYNKRKKYEEVHTKKEQSTVLRSLIADYLYIKDMPYVIDFCEEYINKKLEDYEEVKKFLNELKKLIEEIKNENRKRKNDVIIHYIDAFRAMDAVSFKEGTIKFNILKKYFENMLYFENAYSTGATTYESMQSIICGKIPFEQNIYPNKFLYKFEEFPILQEIYNREYHIQFYTMEEYQIMLQDDRIEYINQIHMPEKLWTMMCNRACSNKPLMCFVYYPWELHFPLLCGYHSAKPYSNNFVDVGIVDMSNYIENQHMDCLKYVDKEFAFYYDFYNKNTYLNIFSDHSQIIYDKEKSMPYYMYYNNKERITHCIMGISGPGIKPMIYHNNFSMIDYNSVLRNYIINKNKSIPNSNIIRWQIYPTYNKNLRNVAKERGYTDYINGIDCYLVDGYIYSCTGNGKKELYKVNDLNRNLINTEEGKKCVKEIIEEYGESKFPDC